MRFLCQFFVICFGCIQCAHSVHLAHISTFIPGTKTKDGRTIYAHSEETLFLGFKNQTDLMDLAVSELMRKCPESSISGITIEYITDLGFPYWTNHIYLTGQCLETAGNKPLLSSG